MELLENPVRPYAWGSRTVIAELRGEPTPSPHPEAEMWLGAHPGDPSHLVGRDGGRTSLLDAVARGPRGAARCGPVRQVVGEPAVPAQGARGGRAAEPAGAPERGPGRRGLRAGERRRHPRRRAHPQLPRRQPQARADLRAHRVPRAGRLPRVRADTSRCCARWTSPSWPRTSALLAAQPDARGPARPVHHVDHPSAVGARPRGARAADGLRTAGPGRRRVRPRGADGAGAVRALPGRRGRARRAAAQPGSCWRRARRSTCPPATCTPTCPAPASS